MLLWGFARVAAVLLPMAFALNGRKVVHSKARVNGRQVVHSRTHVNGRPMAHPKVMKKTSFVSVSNGRVKQRSRRKTPAWRRTEPLLRKARDPGNELWFRAKMKAEERAKDYWWVNLRSSQEYLLNNKGSVYSQNNEDGIIEYLFKHLNTTNKYYVEFGAEDGSQDNTRRLREHFGWHGLTMDNQFENKTIGLYKETVTPNNIAAIFRKHEVPEDMDLLSVDVDSFDAFVLRSILNASYRPRVMIVEANDNFGEDSFFSFPGDVEVKNFTIRSRADCGQMCTFEDPRDKGKLKTAMCGAGVRAVDHIAGKAGYQSVYLNRVNLFLVRKDLLPNAMRENWRLKNVLRQSHGLGREKKSFPRADCQDLRSGLVDVRDF